MTTESRSMTELILEARDVHSSTLLDFRVDTLLAGVAVGRKSDLIELYRQTGTKLFAVLLILVKTSEGAGRLLHDSMVATWQGAPDFVPRQGSGSAWLFSLIHGVAIAQAVEANATVVRKTYEEEATERQAISAVPACFKSLTSETYHALKLSLLYRHSGKELAQALNIPVTIA